LVIRPPKLASDAAMRSAIALGLAIMLSPATRYGYLVYPLALFGAAITLRAKENQDEQVAIDEFLAEPAEV
jgi:hypothetical protein